MGNPTVTTTLAEGCEGSIYAAGTYVITYTYSDDNHELATETVTITINKATPVITVNGTTVNGNAVTITNPTYGVTNWNKVVINVTGVGSESLEFNEDTTITTAGTHTITYTYSGDNNYDSRPITIKVTVAVGSVTEITTTNFGWEDYRTYNGTSIGVPTFTVKVNAKEITSGITVYYMKSNSKPGADATGWKQWTFESGPTDAGTYYVKVVVADGMSGNITNYTGTTKVFDSSFTIGQVVSANITLGTNVTEKDGIYTIELPYVGAAYTLDNTNDALNLKKLIGAAVSGLIDGDSANLVYNIANNVEIKNAGGTYEVTITNDDTNYDITEVPINVVITKATVTIKNATDKTVTYVKDGHTLSSLIGAYANGGGQNLEGIEYWVGEERVTKLTTAGTYTVTVKLNNTNYKADDVTVTVEIKKVVNEQEVTIPTGVKYNDKLTSFALPESNGFGSWSWAAGKDESDNWIFADESTTVGDATDENGRTFYAVFTPYEEYKTNYASRVVEVTIVVNKAAATLNGALTSTTGTYGTYEKTFSSIWSGAILTGGTLKITITYVPNIGDAVTTVITSENGATVTGSIYNAGTYTIVYENIDSNYALDGDGETSVITKTVVINKANPNVSGDGVTLTPTYGETGYTTIPTVTVNGTPISHSSVAYKDADGNDGTATSIVNAGTYTFTYTYAGDNNYNDGTYTTNVNVKKATPVITVNGTTVDTTGANTNKITLADRTYGESGWNTMPTIKVNGVETELTPSTTITGANESGYSITYTYDGNDNYSERTITVTVIVNKATPEITVNGETTGEGKDYTLVYSETRNKWILTLTYKNGAFDLKELISATDNNTDADTNVQYSLESITNATTGTDVTLTLAASANYNEAANVTVTVVVNKATPVITVNGNTVDSTDIINLADRTYGVEGWNTMPTIKVNGAETALTPNTTITGANENGYSITYKYTDETGNYSDRTITVTVKVKKATPIITVNGETVDFTNAITITNPTYGETDWNKVVINVTGVGNVSLDSETDTTIAGANEEGYSITYKYTDGTGNYSDREITVKVVVNKATPTITVNGTTVDTTGANTNKISLTDRTYGESGWDTMPTVNAVIDGINVPLSTTIDKLPGANENGYSITYTYDGNDNYSERTITVTVKVKKATPAISITANTNLTQTDGNWTLTVPYKGSPYTVSDFKTLIGASIVPVGGDSTDLTYTPSVEGGFTTVNGNAEYTVTISYANTINYNVTPVTVNVVITKVTTNTATLVPQYPGSAESWTYGDAIEYAVSNVTFGDKTKATFKFYKAIVSDGEITGYSSTEYVPTNGLFDAGSYKVVATVPGDGTNYVDGTGEATFTVNQKEIDLSQLTIKWNYSSAFTYDGTEKTVSLTGLPNVFTVVYANNKQTNAGNYNATATISYDFVNVKVTGTSADGLTITFTDEDKDGVYTATVTNCQWTISPASITLNGAVDSATNTYGSYADKTFSSIWSGASLSGGKLNITITYTDKSDNVTTWEITEDEDGNLVTTKTGNSTINSIYNAGTYTIVYENIDSNYALDGDDETLIITKTIVINKATPVLGSDFTGKVFYENMIEIVTTTATDGTKSNKLTDGLNDQTVTFTISDGKGGLIEVSGTFAIYNNTYTYTTRNANGTITSSFYYTFAPTDTNNYNSITYSQSGNDNKSTSITLKAVATVGYNGTTYGTIERAFAENSSASEIWVIPDDSGNVVIKGEINISSSTTLILPFGSASTDRNIKGVDGRDYDGSSDGTFNASLAGDSLCTTKVYVASTATITVYGTLEVNGVMSGGASTNAENGAQGNPFNTASGSIYAGATTGAHAKLILLDSAKIVCESGGSVKASGYITAEYSTFTPTADTPSIRIKSGGTLYQPFIVCDYMSGNYMFAVGGQSLGSQGMYSGGEYGLAKQHCMNGLFMTPFNEFAFYNVQPFMRLEHGGKMIVWGNLDTSEQAGGVIGGPQHTDASFIGDNTANSDAFIKISSGGYMTSYIDSNMISHVNFYGGASVGVFKLEMKVAVINANASTEYAFFPLCWSLDITLNNGTYDLGTQKLKLLWGSKLTVAADATLDASDSLIQVYDAEDLVALNHERRTSTAAGQPVVNYLRCKGSFAGESGKLTVNGTLIAGALGGKVYSETSGAKVTINTTSVTSYEGVKFTVATFDSVVSDLHRFKKNALIVASDGSAVIAGSGMTMTYNGTKWLSNKLSFVAVTNGGTNDSASQQITLPDGSTTYQIPNITITTSRTYYTFAYWYVYDDNGNEVKLSDLAGRNIPIDDFTIYIYAKWTPNNYSVKYEYVSDTSTTLPDNLPTPSGLTTFTVETPGSIPGVSNITGWYFLGWYLDSDFTTKVNNYSDIPKVDGGTTIYGRWTDNPTYVVTVTNPENGLQSTINVSESEFTAGTLPMFESQFLNQPTVKFYIAGWSITDENGNVKEISSWSELITQGEFNKAYSITAIWESKYSVILGGTNGLSGSNAIPIGYEGYYTADQIKNLMVSNLTKAKGLDDDTSINMYFKGWTIDDSTYYLTDSSISNIDFSNISKESQLIVKAVWATKIKVTVNYSNSHGLDVNITGNDPDQETIWLKPGGTYSINTGYVSTLKTGDDDVNISRYYGGFTITGSGNTVSYTDNDTSKPVINISASYTGEATVSVVWNYKYAISYNITTFSVSLASPGGSITCGSTTISASSGASASGYLYIRPGQTASITTTATGTRFSGHMKITCSLINGGSGTLTGESTSYYSWGLHDAEIEGTVIAPSSVITSGENEVIATIVMAKA